MLLLVTVLAAAGTAWACGAPALARPAAVSAPAPARYGLSAENIARADAILSQPRPTAAPTAAATPMPDAPPTILTPPASAPTIQAPGVRAVGWQAAFLLSVADAARQPPGQQTGVPVSVTVAQAVLESDWGRSQLARQANNYFGIKALDEPGPAGSVDFPTLEYHARGGAYRVDAAFKAYHSLAESVADHQQLLAQASRYRPLLRYAADPVAYAEGLQRAGYATDPQYAARLIALLDQYNLYPLDRA